MSIDPERKVYWEQAARKKVWGKRRTWKKVGSFV
jgi:hypothetical protein